MKTLCIFATALFVFNIAYAQTDTADKVFSFVEQMPEFPGGDSALFSFIAHNTKYPKYERDNNIQGKVLLQFVVNIDGSVKDIQVIKPASMGLNMEAVRVAKLLPKFKPGYHLGNPVKVFFNLPVVFKITEPPKDSLTLKMTPNAEGVYTYVGINPYFPGGDAALLHFLQQNIYYPNKARNKNIQGRVLVRFTVMEDGSTSDVHVIKSLDPNLDAEAVRVVKLLPKFIPGYVQGKAVKVYFNLPIVFRLN